MASEVDICNTALAHLGDTATVVSLNPPSGDAQSSHCARFYPIARDALLEMHTWGFATVRIALALNASNPSSSWAYCYATPSDVVNYVEIMDPLASDDYSIGVQMAGVGPYSAPVVGLGVYEPQQFVVESDFATGNDILLTNQQNAVLRYTRIVTDTTKFSPLFVVTLSHYLASMLAGPLIKGDQGRQAAEEQFKLAMNYQAQAEGSDANQRRVKPAPGAQWMVNR
jgi:hypothetical protein